MSEDSLQLLRRVKQDKIFAGVIATLVMSLLSYSVFENRASLQDYRWYAFLIAGIAFAAVCFKLRGRTLNVVLLFVGIILLGAQALGFLPPAPLENRGFYSAFGFGGGLTACYFLFIATRRLNKALEGGQRNE